VFLSLKVTTIDVSGTYVAEVRPGATERHNQPKLQHARRRG